MICRKQYRPVNENVYLFFLASYAFERILFDGAGYAENQGRK